MAISLVTSTYQGLGANGGTTGTAIDTSTATLLVVSVSDYEVNPLGTLSDSKSNTWTSLTAYDDAAGLGTARVRLYYAANPTVGTGHTFTYTGSGIYASIGVVAYSGAATTSPLDTGKDSGSAAVGTSLQPGSLTPSEDNCVVVGGFSFDNADTLSINGGFTIHAQAVKSAANWFGGGIASLIQTTAAAANPQWSLTNSTTLATALAVFKSGAAAAPTFVPRESTTYTTF